MRRLPLPTHDSGKVYDTCISKVKDKSLKHRLAAIRHLIIDAADSYTAAASSAQLHTLDTQTTVGGVVSSNEISEVYTLRMARKDAPGRPIYNELLLAPAHGICPLCGQRQVSTLDHHLPKAHYPALAVAPANLVPACMDCNKTKLNAIPHNEEEQTIHPYFDDIESEMWLFARVVENTPPAIQYCVAPPGSWSGCKASRVANHFKLFKLAALYASHAAVELENLRYHMTDLVKSTGPQVIKAHLLAQAKSRTAAHANSWQAAMYRALAESDWYCRGGFCI